MSWNYCPHCGKNLPPEGTTVIPSAPFYPAPTYPATYPATICGKATAGTALSTPASAYRPILAGSGG